MPYNLSKRGIEKYIELVTDYAFKDETSKKDREKFLEISEVFDELQVAGSIYKD